MNILLVTLLLIPLAQVQQGDPTANGDPMAGQQHYRAKLCRNCHGDNGEGGFGPDLAGGRGLTFEQFKRPIRKPWGVMLAYTETQLTDQHVADIYAFLKTKPKITQPGEWHWRAAPPTAPLGQRLYMQTVGCGQCHEPENGFGRKWLGEHAKKVDFEYFAKQIYSHTDKYPRGGMGNYSRDRLPESVLREIYKWMVVDLGLRASVSASMQLSEHGAGNATFNVTLSNLGAKGVGLDAEGLTLFIRVPLGAKVMSGTGVGYRGVQPLATLGLQPRLAVAPHPHDDSGHVERPANPDLSRDVVVWRIPKLNAGEQHSLSFVLSGMTPSAEVFQQFAGSTIHWEKPGRNTNASPPMLIYRDLRLPDKGDHELVVLPRLPAATGGTQ